VTQEAARGTTESGAAPSAPAAPRAWANVLIATLVMLLVAVGLRFGPRPGAPVWDEPLMQPVVGAIVDTGWTVPNLIDYEDTKGPVFFWGYAAAGEVFGTSIERLRLITTVLFILAGIPLGLLATRCGWGARRTAGLATLFALLPYHAVLGQLFMSEPSFLLGSMTLILAFVWSFTSAPGTPARTWGPVVFALMLSLLLHHRPHAVAYAAAAVLVATERDRARSWPWWIACALAGASRLPLLFHWGGMVSPAYQDRMGLGLRLDSLCYLLIALLPATACLIWRPLTARPVRWTWLVGGAALGLALGLLAVPDLGLDVEAGRARYLGMVASALRPLAATGVFPIAFALLATLGGAALGAMMSVAFEEPMTTTSAIVGRLAAWSVLAGWALYGVTRGQVFDRYLLPFVLLLPFMWMDRLPRWLLVLQGLGLAALTVRSAMSWGVL